MFSSPFALIGVATIPIFLPLTYVFSFTGSSPAIGSLLHEKQRHSIRTGNPRVAAICAKKDNGGDELLVDPISRRRALTNAALTFSAVVLPGTKSAKADPENLNAFNSLTFNYRGSDYGGLDAATIDGPSVSYKDFLERLESGEVAFVEFLAPDGDEAYVTFKAKEGEKQSEPIRIGQGYPVEQHDGWSSPAFAIRSVKEKGVPFKFVVPGLAKYR